MEMWIIYKRPKDFPEDNFVARRWLIGPGKVDATADIYKAETLDRIRGQIPAGMQRMNRLPGDDPAIVEVWV